jgi:hypothetical protein
MTGLLQTQKTPVGQATTLLREDGTTEVCEVVPGGAPIGAGTSGVWFVDKSAPAGGNGSIDSPFNLFGDAFTAADAAVVASGLPQVIWVTPGPYAEPPQSSATGGFTLTVVGWNIAGDIALTPDTAPTLPSITFTGAGVLCVNLVGCNIGSVDVATGEVTLTSTIASGVTCDVLKARDSQFGVAGWTATTSADISNCVLGAGAGVSALATIRNCPQPAAPVNITGSVNIDAFTNAWQQITASVVLQVIDKPAQFSVGVVVPAVGAGNVDYVDTVLGGELATAPTDTPVTGNPHADLAAAGAGGGFINCRMSAPGTVRCAFIGPIAGGLTLFTFTVQRQP